MSVRPHDMPPYPRGDGEQTAAAPRGDAVSVVLTVVGLLLVACAITLAAYPFVSSKWEAYRASRQFSAERATASQYDEEAVGRLIADAEAYNASISGNQPDAAAKPYDIQLLYDDSPILCWLEIPSLDIKLPVYRDDGTDEVPADGAEHMRGTSLPVGGDSSNAVITAHSGSHRGTSMAFNKLDLLEVGDLIVVWTLGRPYAYQVVGWEQTEPDDVGNMRIVDGRDQLTLLTCRPIGTTSKRLFVHAERTDYELGEQGPARVESIAGPDFRRFLAACACGGVILWFVLILLWRRKRIWYLNRMLGAVCVPEHEIAAAQEDSGRTMSLELRHFGRAKLVLADDAVKGSWRRVKGDASRITLNFAGRSGDNPVLTCSQRAADWGLRVVALANESFEAQSLDDELSFEAAKPEIRLVFSREKPRTREEDRARWEADRR